jgi:hypothetical protein
VTSEGVVISSTCASVSTGPTDYVDVVSASDKVKDHFPAARDNLRDVLRTGEERHVTLNSARKPNHDPDPKVTAMTLTINDTVITSDQTTHSAWQEPCGHTWKVLWLPRQLLDRNSAGLGLIRHNSVARASRPYGDISGQQRQYGKRPDPDVTE